MESTVLDRPSVETVTIAISKIQEHLNKEARNRRQITLQPKELCPMQKAELVQDLRFLLD